MDWMRQVVEWHEETEEHIRQNRIGLELNNRVREERIFVYTPKGHVLDLTTGATALDFAYRVHTEVGHRCRGARVDGQPVALNTPLLSGQRVEILTGDQQEPLRFWLHQHLACMHTARAREKVSDWFRGRPDSVNEAEGRRMLVSTFERLLLPLPGEALVATAARSLNLDSAQAAFIALGSGDCEILDLLAELIREWLPVRPSTELPAQMSLLDELDASDDDAPSGVSYSVEILAEDRPGLLMDITIFLRRQGIALRSNTGRVLPERGQAVILIEVLLEDLLALCRLMDGLELIPGVLQTQRLASDAEV
jgi:(p)ppGpp synthase/HD superfamily hydrolase